MASAGFQVLIFCKYSTTKMIKVSATTTNSFNISSLSLKIKLGSSGSFFKPWLIPREILHYRHSFQFKIGMTTLTL